MGRGARAGPARVSGGLTATAALSVDRCAGRQRIRWTHAWPIVLRPTGDDRVHLVHGAGGPLGGDVLSLAVDVGAGAELEVRSAGATLVQPGPAGERARWDTVVTVGPGAWLGWAPQAVIVSDGAAFDTSLRMELAAGARAAVREIVVLGRLGGRGGRYRSELTVTLGCETLLAHAVLLDGDDAALSGPGGSAGARAVGTMVVVGAGAGRDRSGESPGVRWAWTGLEGPGAMLMAVGAPGPVTALLDAASADLAAGRVAADRVAADLVDADRVAADRVGADRVAADRAQASGIRHP